MTRPRRELSGETKRGAPAAGAAAGKRICVAQIGAPHGVRGDVRLKAFTEEPAALARYGGLESEDGGRLFEIERLRADRDRLIAHFRGVDDRNAALALTHARLYVPRERLPAIEEKDQFYHADLIGLVVWDASGKPIGSVAAVHNFGAGDVIEMRPADGGPTVLLPFTRAVFPLVDVEEGRLVADLPAGVLGNESADSPEAR